jgi:N-acetylglucosaminyldiphosphoundecaprenol N-acetyl-beta-D-mannosaminyltransferase
MTEPGNTFPRKRAVCAPITLGTFSAHVAAFADLGAAHRSGYVCCVNAHMTVECHRDPAFRTVVEQADFATADGMPVVKALRLLHGIRQQRVAGNDIMPALLAEAAQRGLSAYLYGGTTEVQDRIRSRAAQELPNLRWAGMHAPPFGPLEALDLTAEADRINATGAHIVFVSLGCPKQERWMAAMKGRVNAIMLGLGGAFLLYAGVDRRAPKWMRDLSLEWTYRLWLEPRRLWMATPRHRPSSPLRSRTRAPARGATPTSAGRWPTRPLWRACGSKAVTGTTTCSPAKRSA